MEFNALCTKERTDSNLALDRVSKWILRLLRSELPENDGGLTTTGQHANQTQIQPGRGQTSQSNRTHPSLDADGNTPEGEPRRQTYYTHSISYDGGNSAEGEPRRQSQRTHSTSFEGGNSAEGKPRNSAEGEPRRHSQRTHSTSSEGGNSAGGQPRNSQRTVSTSFEGNNRI
ncbi:hypothetical protein AVEN_152643-1 [Araneus ventricosus]|uniref:Uncharacterized protein n=1 Tax=Araneus ventricosus TaxID=182803 RepID=A0A4Y2NFD5_ARAVE|nr:hypothetical protein AVEN_152643-1 [Araneus ventricosus]